MNRILKSIGVAACVLATVILATGCTFTRSQTTINTPAVYSVAKDATGNLQTNLVSPASVKTITAKERIWLPEGYACRVEDDLFGINVTMTSQSSSLPNIKAGEAHSSLTLIPTSTNQLYAAAMSVDGSLDNKAVPFWMSSKGTMTIGNSYVTQSADTNGTSSTAGAAVPGVPTPQQTK